MTAKKSKKPQKQPPERRVRQFALVARMRVEVAVVEIRAPEDDNSAVQKSALKTAAKLTDGEWQFDLPYEGEPVLLDVNQDRDELEVYAIKDQRFGLLTADIETGEGGIAVAQEAWLPLGVSDLMTSDIVSDWIKCLKALNEHRLSFEVDNMKGNLPPGFLDDLLPRMK